MQSSPSSATFAFAAAASTAATASLATTQSCAKIREQLSASPDVVFTFLSSHYAESADDIASVLFTTSPDLVSDFPARAARERVPGWEHVPLMNAHEMAVPHGQVRCIRVLVLWNTDKAQDQIEHIYLREAHNLRER